MRGAASGIDLPVFGGAPSMLLTTGMFTLENK